MGVLFILMLILGLLSNEKTIVVGSAISREQLRTASDDSYAFSSSTSTDTAEPIDGMPVNTQMATASGAAIGTTVLSPPTDEPTVAPAPPVPTNAPFTAYPTISRYPTRFYTRRPTTAAPISKPVAAAPSAVPSLLPTPAPSTARPSLSPSAQPSRPTSAPTTAAPSALPTTMPSQPTGAPTSMPTASPTRAPTRMPTHPTRSPSFRPTCAPSSSRPSSRPSRTPSAAPTTAAPTSDPTELPSSLPTVAVVPPADFLSSVGLSLILSGGGSLTGYLLVGGAALFLCCCGALGVWRWKRYRKLSRSGGSGDVIEARASSDEEDDDSSPSVEAPAQLPRPTAGPSKPVPAPASTGVGARKTGEERRVSSSSAVPGEGRRNSAFETKQPPPPAKPQPPPQPLSQTKTAGTKERTAPPPPPLPTKAPPSTAVALGASAGRRQEPKSRDALSPPQSRRSFANTAANTAASAQLLRDVPGPPQTGAVEARRQSLTRSALEAREQALLAAASQPPRRTSSKETPTPATPTAGRDRALLLGSLAPLAEQEERRLICQSASSAPAKPRRSATSRSDSLPAAANVVPVPVPALLSSRQVSERLAQQMAALQASLGVVLYTAPLEGTGTYTREEADALLQESRRRSTDYHQPGRASFSPAEVHGYLEEQARLLERRLRVDVPFCRVENRSYSRAQLRTELLRQQREHIDLFRRSKAWRAAEDDGSDASGFLQLARFLHRL